MQLSLAPDVCMAWASGTRNTKASQRCPLLSHHLVGTRMGTQVRFRPDCAGGGQGIGEEGSPGDIGA